jgi:hypothetical protein
MRSLQPAHALVIGSFFVMSGSMEWPALATSSANERERPSQTVNTNQSTSSRFIVLAEYNDQVVRDTKTGLIWERSPRLGLYDWEVANQQCLATTAGGQTGWRVPTVEELKSLIDASSTDLTLPAGHPFRNVESAIYWSASKHTTNPNSALFVNFSSGRSSSLEKQMSSFVWCVRSPANER